MQFRKEEAPEAEKSAQTEADQDTNITEAEPTVEVGADEVNEEEEEEDSDDVINIFQGLQKRIITNPYTGS